MVEMREQSFLAINSEEFIEAIARIEEKDFNLKVIKKEERKIVLLFSIFFPISLFSFLILREEKNQIKVKKKINFLPLLTISTLLLAFLEIIIYITLLYVGKQNVVSYLLIVIFWFFLNWYFIVLSLEKLDNVIFFVFNKEKI